MKDSVTSPSRPFSFVDLLLALFRPSVVVAVLYAVLILLIAIPRNYGALDFVHLGTIWNNHIKSGTWGYDGQFYYQLAPNPLQAYRYMDNASYCYQHILYGLVVGALPCGLARRIDVKDQIAAPRRREDCRQWFLLSSLPRTSAARASVRKASKHGRSTSGKRATQTGAMRKTSPSKERASRLPRKALLAQRSREVAVPR